MNSILLRLLLLATVFAPMSLLAGQHDFKCVPTDVHTLNGEGIMVPDEMFQLRSKAFIVDRESGRVTGGLLDNSRMTILLVDKGSSQQSFKTYAHTSSQVTH